MLLPDVNILIYAYRADSDDHDLYRDWLQALADGEEAFGMSDLVLAGFLRVVTNPRAFKIPTPTLDALAFIDSLRTAPNCSVVSPGPRHWDIFTGLCRGYGIRGKLIPDAYHAALAIESGNEWVSTDSDFSRFPGLRWRRPFG